MPVARQEGEPRRSREQRESPRFAEEERHERHRFAEELRHATEHFIAVGWREAKPLYVHEREIPVSDVAQDVRHFHEQSDFLRYVRLCSPIAFALEHDPERDTFREIPVLIKLQKPFGLASILATDYFRLSGFKTAYVNDAGAKRIFTDRVSDFVRSRLMAGDGEPLEETIIDSRRPGDTVLYAKGYFLSTGQACGTSTPATVYLPPGRYSFGIDNDGVPDFERVLWPIPTPDGHVDLKKP